jgi:4,4'-diaponeurosporenoate glycosyltransferase
VGAVTWAPFVVGWAIGWMLLWRPRPLPGGTRERPAISVIVPARNEAHALPALLRGLGDQVTPPDEVIVVDDHSTDDTAAIARAHGAAVVTPPPPPSGWLGKPHACWHGTGAAGNDLFVFLDADVLPRPGLLDGLAAASSARLDALVSVQPWHEPGTAGEQLSLFCNLAAMTGAGSWSVLGRRVRPRVAFGPVIAVPRDVYERVGGHARPDVRAAHTEDIALARAVGEVDLHSGHPHVSFRMYPGGVRELVAGWTRSLASGAGAAPRWAAIATALWMWALAAAPFVGWWAYAAAVVQVGVLGRRAGRFSPWVALAYPIPLLVFVWLGLRSLTRFALRRDVRWKDRSIPAR